MQASWQSQQHLSGGSKRSLWHPTAGDGLGYATVGQAGNSHAKHNCPGPLMSQPRSEKYKPDSCHAARMWEQKAGMRVSATSKQQHLKAVALDSRGLCGIQLLVQNLWEAESFRGSLPQLNAADLASSWLPADQQQVTSMLSNISPRHHCPNPGHKHNPDSCHGARMCSILRAMALGARQPNCLGNKASVASSCCWDLAML
ncbi:hypothetical protein WJX73_009100 [Symbiochloris irregularis]|uniref:Uncharacterized protein n=1 Tax=Symbiochloris irregularis TaxID=706552 RepID=A0AAW1NLQ4_9CHLO